MFHFPTSPPHRLCIHLQVTPHNWCWVSPFGHPRINALLATPRGLTQPHTSFIGPACQGIHHTPVTQNNNYGRYKNCRQLNKQKLHKRTRCSRPLYSSHTTHTPRRPTTTTDDQPTMECHNKEHTMLPQTPNSMPTHHQFHCCTNVLSVVHPSVHTPQPHPILTSSMMIVVGCVSTRTFLKQTGGSTTLGYSTTTPTTVGEK